MENAIIPRASIDEIIGYRRRSLELFEQAYATMGEAREMARRAAPRGCLPSMPDDIKRLLESCPAERTGEYQKGITKFVDQAVWDHIITAMGVEKLMDAQARDKFRHELRTNPPEVNADNVRATIETLVGDSGLIFRRGIANAFSRLDRRFRTHDAFKIGSKIIFSWAFNKWGCWSGRTDEYLRDVERTFHVLDGKEQPERYAGIIGAIDQNRRGGLECSAFTAESEYFRVKAFKNGNLHVWFTRDDLIEKVNLLLAEYYDGALGDASEEARAAADKGRRDLAPAKNFGFFPTPDELADRVLDEAWIQEGDRVLEPSAGSGQLSRRAAEKGGLVTCIETQPNLVSALEQDERYVMVLCDDFMSVDPKTLGEFEKIVMNPPFDKGLDILHVDHALNFLAPGGKLVAIMSAGAEFRDDKMGTAFRNRIERMGGHFRDLPAESFASVGTMVNTVLLTVSRKKF